MSAPRFDWPPARQFTIGTPSGALGMEKDPDLKSLQGDPRFVALVAYAKERVAAAQEPK